jgi:hypothetical protein
LRRKSLTSRLGLGWLAYHLYHRYASPLRDCLAAGGPWQVRRTRLGEAEMAEAARRLPPVPAPSEPAAPPVVMHLLTGRRYWHQTAFCLWTFARHSGRQLAPVILDDGTLSAEFADPLRRLFPLARVEGEKDIIARLDERLPAARFPFLRARRKEFPLLRKLTDLHAGLGGWRLFIDSDLLFLRRPDFLIDWHDRPDRPLRGEDVVTSYGYPLPLLAELAGRPVTERINTGTLGLRGDELDWERLEFWCRELQTRVGPHYYQEQALVALLLAGRDCAVPPPEDYVVLPSPPEALARRAVMHHYVAHSKRWYFQHNWRSALSP